MTPLQKTRAIAALINRFSAALPFFEVAHVKAKERRVLWMAGGCIGSAGWAYTFASGLSPEAAAKVATESLQDHGIDLSTPQKKALLAFCEELCQIRDEGNVRMDSWDYSECCWIW